MHLIDDDVKNKDNDMPPPGFGRGLVSRDPATQGVGMVGLPVTNIKLIPRAEWSARIKEGNETKSFLSHIRRRGDNGKPIPSLDQNGQGYCWAYGTTAAVMLLRAKANQPYVRLSGHSVGCKVKNFRDEGGWGALSLDFINQNGVAPVDAWPEKSMSRQNDRPETWTAAKKFITTADWMDIADPVHDRDMTFDQIMTLLLSGIPVVADMMDWGHCTVWMDPVEVEPGSFGVKGWNSWTDQWGDLGEYVRRGSKAIPENAVAPSAVMAD